MTDRDALVRAICENPDDDVLRLAYADFLEEDGDPARADFVRTQVEYAQTPPGSPVYPFVHWRSLQFERQYTTALRADGTLATWGNYFSGSGNATIPPDVLNVAQIAARGDHGLPGGWPQPHRYVRSQARGLLRIPGRLPAHQDARTGL